jgi:hypothetical protein
MVESCPETMGYRKGEDPPLKACEPKAWTTSTFGRPRKAESPKEVPSNFQLGETPSRGGFIRNN